MKWILFLSLWIPETLYSQSPQSLPVPTAPLERPLADGVFVLKFIWALPQLQVCRDLLEKTIGQMDKKDLISLAQSKLDRSLPPKIEKILRTIDSNVKSDNLNAMANSFHWNVGKNRHCRISLYQDLGQLKSYLPETQASIMVERGKEMRLGAFEGVLAGVHYDFEANKVTLDPSKAFKALEQVDQRQFFTERTNEGRKNLNQALSHFQQEIEAANARPRTNNGSDSSQAQPAR